MDAFSPKTVEDAIRDELVRRGLTRFSKRRVGLDLGNGFTSWLGIIGSRRGQEVDLVLFAGIHCKPIEKMWTSLNRTHVTKYSINLATYAKPMEFVDDRYKSLPPLSKNDILSQIENYCDMLTSSAIEFSRSIASYGALLPLLQSRVGSLGAFPEKYCCCLYLVGRQDEAIAFLENFKTVSPGYLCDFPQNFARLCRH